MEYREEKSVSGAWYLLGGLVVGAVAGVLLAPKSGLELRADIAEWRRRNRDKAQSLMSRIREAIPARVKAAAALGAAKGATREAISSAGNELKEFGED